MMKSRPLRLWLASFGLCAAAVVFCYWAVDRPVAEFTHSHLQQKAIFDSATHLPDPFVPTALIVLLAAGFLAVAGRRLSGLFEAATIAAFSLIWAAALKTALKIAFGRTWPESWIDNYPSYIGTHDFGFHPFSTGPAFQSFPSGHMSVTVAVVAVFWMLYPKYRLLYVAAAAIVAAGLIGMNYHFVSDVIAGSFLGATTAWLSLKIWTNHAR